MRLTRSRTSERGVAMLLALMTLVLVAGLATLMFARTLNETRHSADDTAIVQTLMLARGGANVGSGLLGLDLHDNMRLIVELTATPGRWAFGNDMPGFLDDAPEPQSVINEMTPATSMLQSRVDNMVCDVNIMPDSSAGDVSLRIYFTDTACGEDLPATVTLPQPRFVKGPPRSGGMGLQEYAIPFVMVSEATLNNYRRNIVMQGEYRFEVGKGSFSYYAYFTNRDSTSSNQIYFTENSMIDGPVHTNGHFSFYKDPWFGGRVTSAGCGRYNSDNSCRDSVSAGAYFYGQGFRTTSEMNPNSNNPSFSNSYGTHAPRLEDGVAWDAQYVPLPENAFDQRAVARGEEIEGEARLDRGLYFGDDLHSLTIWGGNNRGVSPTLQSNGTWSPASEYQYVRPCTWEVVGEERYRQGGSWRTRDVYGEVCQLYRYNEAGTLQRLHPDSDLDNPNTWTWITEDRPFNGVVYVAGEVERFKGPDRPRNVNDGKETPPALARFAQITVVTEDDIRITGDIRYEQPPCSSSPVRNANRSVTPAVCNNVGHPNVLGVFTPDGDIIVGNDNNDSTLNAPKNVHVHAVLMSASDQIRVEGYKERTSFKEDRGELHLLGGMIQENRGVFGTFTAGQSGGRKGYDRIYTYDPRMARGLAPPYFPTTGLDTVAAVRYFSFGQREQVY